PVAPAGFVVVANAWPSPPAASTTARAEISPGSSSPSRPMVAATSPSAALLAPGGQIPRLEGSRPPSPPAPRDPPSRRTAPPPRPARPALAGLARRRAGGGGGAEARVGGGEQGRAARWWVSRAGRAAGGNGAVAARAPSRVPPLPLQPGAVLGQPVDRRRRPR